MASIRRQLLSLLWRLWMQWVVLWRPVLDSVRDRQRF